MRINNSDSFKYKAALAGKTTNDDDGNYKLQIENYNALIDSRNFYDQPINEMINSMMKSEKYQ